MKKFLKITAAVFLALCLFIFSGCERKEKTVGGGDSEIPESFNGPFSVADGGMSFYLEITEKGVRVYESCELKIPYQNFPPVENYNISEARDGLIFSDLNFDGYTDFAFPKKVHDGHVFYAVYLWEDDKKFFSLNTELSEFADIEPKDGYLTGFKHEGGVFEKTSYYFENGLFTEKKTLDLTMETALKYAEAFLKEEGLRAEYVKKELVAKCLCSLYFIYDGDGICAYIAVSYDRERVFWSNMNDVYFELEASEEGYKKSAQSYGKMPYTGNVYTYVSEGYNSLGEHSKDLYGDFYSRIISFKEVSSDDADAAEALSAVMADHPLLYLYFSFHTENGKTDGKYFYSWAPYEYEFSPDTAQNIIKSYEEFTDGIINEMPVGLEPLEKYIYLAQALQIKQHEKDEPDTGLLIYGDTNAERLSRTFAYLCEKAQVYCTASSGTNIILLEGEKRDICLEDVFKFSPGSDEWQNEFLK